MNSRLELTVVHASLDTFLKDRLNKQDINNLLDLNADSYALTETGQEATVDMIKDLCEKRRTHRAINPDNGDVTFMLKKGDVIPLGHGGKLIVPAGDGHGPRHNSFVEFDYHGENITHTAIHAVALHADKRSADVVRQRKNQQANQIEAAAEQTKRMSRGKKLGILSGDFNAILPNNRVLQDILDEYGLTTTAHETGVMTPTHGGHRIDYICTYDKDRRLRVDDMRVLRGPQWNSDHDPLVVEMSIARSRHW